MAISTRRKTIVVVSPAYDAKAYAASAAADAIATADDRVQTGLDAAAASTSAAQAALLDGPWLHDVATLLADTGIAYGAGAGDVAAGAIVRTRSEGFAYEVAASAAVDQHVTTAGGVKLYVILSAGGQTCPEAFGAIGDGVTDCSAAWVKMLNAWPDADGFDVILEASYYKLSSTPIYITRAIKHIGKAPIQTKLDFSACASVVNAPYNCHVITVHPNNITGTSASATPITLPVGWVGDNGAHGGFFNIGVVCNSAIADGNGVFFNIGADSTSLSVSGANLHNIVVAASATSLETRGGLAGPTGLDIGGNSNNGVYTDLIARSAINGDGIFVTGSDANANQFNHADSAHNKGWGINDTTLHGNTYVQPHTAGNLFGAYRTRPASANRSLFLAPYVEGGQGADNGNYYYEMNGLALIIGAQGALPDNSSTSSATPLRAITAENAGIVSRTALVVADNPGATGATGAFSRLGKGDFTVRTVDGKAVEIKRVSSAFSGLFHDGAAFMYLPNAVSGERQVNRPELPNGFNFSVTQSHKGGFSAAPTTGAHQKGAVVWNSNPVAGGYVGFVCITGGTPGVWKGFGLIEA